MKARITNQPLSTATQRMQGAIAERSLAQIGLKAEGGSICVAAIDRILAVYSSLDCEVSEEGTVFVPARLFSDVVKELPSGPVVLERDGSSLIVNAGSSGEFTMRLPIIDEVSWKDPPTFQTENRAEMPADHLCYMIEQVQFCVAQESPRNYGTVGFLHKPDKEHCRLVGTDGFRLSYCEVDAAMPDGFLENGVCLSKRALAEMHRMGQEAEEDVTLSISEDETTLLAEIPNYRLFIRLSSVKYPNYLGVLPKDDLTGVLVSRPYLQSVAKRVLLAADKSRALQLSFSESSLTLNSKTTGSSESNEMVPLEDYHGPKFDIAVNGKFLTDVFSTTGSDHVTLQFNRESKEDPIVITPRSEPSECHSRHVLVPIKQNG